jgi:hypothetical protein
MTDDSLLIANPWNLQRTMKAFVVLIMHVQMEVSCQFLEQSSVTSHVKRIDCFKLMNRPLTALFKSLCYNIYILNYFRNVTITDFWSSCRICITETFNSKALNFVLASAYEIVYKVQM